MAFSSLFAFACLGAVLLVDAGQASRNALLNNKRSISERATQKHGNQPNRPVPNAYLNDKTRPYWVDGIV